ncbi:hypothetical protein KZZ52_58445 [Dactylosporangium sp. AC04546]|uniref:hypothetical protein n=1 Tax=Dactylosporangium sp. AC04546 TaxID=2862460 RepID=UPI001EDDCBEE|nr:hypothetical protein [Dactylosporangium sp. AC04546]WVK83579.1 hypothetical protein KZZ52_58445 [Dactylosporangium sp. AC04546]
MSRVGVVSSAVVVAALGLSLGGCGRLGDVISETGSARDCHPDPETVAALRQEPVLTQAPPGANLAATTETVSCGWDSPGPPNLGMLDSEVTGAGAAGDVSTFYADLARSSGWRAYGQSSSHVFAASKSDETKCSWLLQVRQTAEGTYHVQITYTPRDLRPTCL